MVFLKVEMEPSKRKGKHRSQLLKTANRDICLRRGGGGAIYLINKEYL